MQSEGWKDFGIPRISAYRLVRRSEDVLRHITEAGVLVPPDNRISRAAKLLRALDEDVRAGRDVDRDDLARQAVLVEAHRTLFESFVVLFARGDRPSGNEAISKTHLQAFLDGRDLPDPAADTPRDLQFEAYVGACLSLSGLSVRAREPDFELLYHSKPLGVAAKRLTSTKPARVYDRLRHATNQLRDSYGAGFVALNLDGWLTEPLSGATPEEVGREFTASLQSAYMQMRKLATRSALRGTLVFASWHGWDFSGSRSRFALRMGVQTVVITDSDDDEGMAKRFFAPAYHRLRSSFGELGKLIAPRT